MDRNCVLWQTSGMTSRASFLCRSVFAGIPCGLILGCLLLSLCDVQSLAKGGLYLQQGPRSGKHASGNPSPGNLPRKTGRLSYQWPRKGSDFGDLKWIPAGTFTMGAPSDDGDASVEERPTHTVILTQGFWMCDHEVTQAEYQDVMRRVPSEFKGPDRPVENVTWFDAVAYCQKLTEREVKAGRIPRRQEYRLPTEAEREYACRAGTTTPRYGKLDAIAWWSGNSGGQTHPVRQMQPNAWGLHDMLGNVDEWCADWFGDYSAETVTDPAGPLRGTERVVRGASWFFEDFILRSSSRGSSDPGVSFNDTGFRVVLAEVR